MGYWNFFQLVSVTEQDALTKRGTFFDSATAAWQASMLLMVTLTGSPALNIKVKMIHIINKALLIKQTLGIYSLPYQILAQHLVSS